MFLTCPSLNKNGVGKQQFPDPKSCALYNSNCKTLAWDEPITVEQLRAAYKAEPFRPFSSHLADGRELPVLSHEFIMTAPGGRTIVVHQPDDAANIIDMLLVKDLEFKPTNGSRKRK